MIVNNLITAMESDPNLLVPIVELTALTAKKTLIQMVESLPEGPFLEFLNNYVKYSVEVFASLDCNGNLVFKGIKGITTPLIAVTDNSSVYALSCYNDFVNYYIGSASNTFNRISQHLDCLRGLRPSDGVHKRLLDLCEIPNIYWSTIYGSVNYYKLALLFLPPTYELSLGEVQILRAFTEFVVRILEQSLISHLEPAYNSLTNLVVFTYNVWDAGLLNVYNFLSDGSRGVQILNAITGEIIRAKVSSIAQACDILQISRNMANRYLNSSEGFYSVIFGCQVTLGVIGMALYAKKISKLPYTNSTALTDLPPYLVWLFKENKTDFLGPYVNYTQTARALSPSKFSDNTKSKPSHRQ